MTGTDVEKRSVSARLLLDYADLSPNEIAEKTGFTAVEAAQKLLELLSDRDWLTMKQREQVLIHQMEDLIRESRQKLNYVHEDNYAPTLNAVVRAMDGVGKRLDMYRRNTDIDLAEITRAQARVFGGAYNYAIDYFVDMLLADHPEVAIDDDEVRQWKIMSMDAAKRKLQESVSND